MDEIDFKKPFQTLCDRFSKPWKKNLADVYFDRCKRIPGSVFEEIVKRIIDNSRMFPTPQEIKNEFFNYLDDHPEKRARKKTTPCPYCNGMGWLEYLATEPGHNMRNKDGELQAVAYRRVCRCGFCNNWEYNFISKSWPMMTIKEIREKGFDPTGATQYRLETMESEKKLTEFKALNKCVQMVGKPIPF